MFSSQFRAILPAQAIDRSRREGAERVRQKARNKRIDVGRNEVVEQ